MSFRGGLDEERAIKRLESLKPTITRMLSSSSTAGLSYRVLHHGKVIHIDNFGFRDVDRRLAVDEQTIFPICSMTKNLVSSALGIIMHESEDGIQTLNRPLQEVLSDYNPIPDSMRTSATLADWMSMRTGTQSYQPWFQSHNNVIFPQEDAFKIINSLQQVNDLRSQFRYSNWGYELAARTIRHLSGQTWDAVLHSRIFEPLELHRTVAHGDLSAFDNVAESYTTLDDGTPVHIRRTPLSGATLLGAGGGVSSCTEDLLKLYKEVLRACVHQFETGESSTSGSPFKYLNQMMSAQTILPGPSFRESTYGFGWLRTELPNVMFKISPNLAQLGGAPILGRGSPSKLLIAHYGSMPGACCGLNLFPETQSAIVVLTNSTPLCDISDWLCQLLTQTLFDFSHQNDYISWTEKAVEKEKLWHPNVVRELEAKKVYGTLHRFRKLV
ncbi:MAG: hypothetical protein M1820_007091 [Bogoriella megaspora]|nr:MAG: hypothetical protein M1820_007091 [Bogoriella megaspora]